MWKLKKKREICTPKFQKEKKNGDEWNEDVGTKKKKILHQDLEYKESIWDKFGGMFDFFEEIFVHEWI